jgi:hypothetical protein
MEIPAAKTVNTIFLRLVLAGLALFGGGCVTSPDRILFTAAGPGWTVSEGQALWRPGRKHPELAGEIVLATNGGGCGSVNFTKTLLPVVLAQTTKTNWLIEFPPQRLGFSGRGRPPQRFTWLFLAAALEGERLPGKIIFTRQPGGGWRLENRRTGETVEGFLQP